MRKFGLPDICIPQIASADSRAGGNLINSACQALVERGALDAPGRLDLDLRALRCASIRDGQVSNLKKGGTGKAVVELAHAQPEKGDADNRLAEIRFDRSPGLTETERQNAFLAALLGAEDSVAAVSHDGAEFLAAWKETKQARF